jgi:excisionase family DNA binding protein
MTSRKLTLAEVGERWRVHPRTVSRWMKDETLAVPRPLQIGRSLLFDEEALEQWEQDRAKLGRSAPVTVED